jgi:REP element-mobilizing transposase RayT
LTLQVVGWVDVFTRKENKDVIIENLKYCQVKKGLVIYAYVIMTNHIHLIVRSENESLSDAIRDFKKYVSKKLKKQLLENYKESRKDWMKVVFEYHAKFNKRVGAFQLWTHDNHAILLDTKEKFESRENYIHLNPVRAGIVRNPEDY